MVVNGKKIKKVLLIAPDFNNYTEIFSKSISEFGYKVEALSFTPYNWKTALLKKLHLNQEKLINNEVDAFNSEIVRKYKSFAPDYVIVIRGDFVRKETLEIMKGTRKAIWLYDSITRYPKSSDNWEMYDLHYVFEQSDIEILRVQGKQAFFLPLGYDGDRYYPIKQENQDIDISFVGAMYGNRKKLLENVARRYDDLNLAFYGPYVLKRNIVAYLKFWKSDWKNAFKNKRISHEDANQLYARSKININILHEQSKEGWNARLNEILGAGGFQIVTHNDLIAEKYFGMLDTFRSDEELIEKIEYYLSHPEIRRQMSFRGYQWVKNNETYCVRFAYILSQLNSLD